MVIVEASVRWSAQRMGMRIPLKPASLTVWIISFVVLGLPQLVSEVGHSSELPRFQPITTPLVHSWAVISMPVASGSTAVVCACTLLPDSMSTLSKSKFLIFILVV